MGKPDGGPAFPTRRIETMAAWAPDETPHPFFVVGEDGMSLRDYFAGQALAAVIALSDREIDEHDETPIETVARQAYTVADAMLKVREESS